MYFLNVFRLIFILLITLYNFHVGSATICCTPDQWEGRIFLDDAQIAFFIHANASADVTYDYTNSRAFINASYVQRSLYITPHIQREHVMYIEDYKNNVEYEVDNFKDCQKAWMDFNMTKQCINDRDKVLYRGPVGHGIETVTYNTSLGESYPNIRATIQKDTCLPVQIIYIDTQDMGSIVKLDAYNISPGIKDPSVFNVPPQCKHAELTHKGKDKDPIRSRIRAVILNKFIHGIK